MNPIWIICTIARTKHCLLEPSLFCLPISRAVPGSPRQYPDAMPSLLARHHSILHQSIQAHDGYVFQIIGDAFCAAFHTAPDALCAALAAQRSLQHEAWDPAPDHGAHGHPHRRGASDVLDDHSADYHGYLTLACVQSVMTSAHGGQVLLSAPAPSWCAASCPKALRCSIWASIASKGWHDPRPPVADGRRRPAL